MIKKIIIQSGFQTVGKIITVLISMAATAIITRTLGVKEYGYYSFLMAFIGLLVAVGSWGTQIVGVREMAKAKNKAQIFTSVFLLRLFLSFFATIIGIIVILALPTFSEIKLIAFLTIPLVIAITGEATFEIVFQTLFRMDLKTIINIISYTVFLGGTILFLKLGFRVIAPISAWFIAKALAIIIAQTASRKLLPNKAKAQKDLALKIFKESLPVGTLLVIFATYDQAIDSLVIKSFLGAEKVGIYGLAYKIYENLVLPAYFLVNTTFPILVRSHRENFKKIINKVGRLITLGAFIVIPLTIIFNKTIITIIAGPDFVQAGPVLKILSLSLIFSYLNHLTGFSLIALKKQAKSLRFGLAALFWNLFLNITFVPKYGILAAAWITVSTEALISILSFRFLLRELKT